MSKVKSSSSHSACRESACEGGGTRPSHTVAALIGRSWCGVAAASLPAAACAIDDGAGIGITVAAAKLIKDRYPDGLKRTIRVIMWGSEEVGLVGAKEYAKAHADELENFIVAAESDFGAGKVWKFNSFFAEEKLGYLSEIAETLRPLGIAKGDNEASGGPDVGALKAKGVPVVSLQQNGWDYFDLHHTPNYTLDKIDPDDLAQNVAAYAAFIFLSAQIDDDFRADEPEIN